MNVEVKYAGKEEVVRKRSSISIVDQFLRVKDVRKKQRQVFLDAKLYFKKTNKNYLKNLCVHKLNSVPRKRKIYMIPALVGICFALYVVLFVLLFISD